MWDLLQNNDAELWSYLDLFLKPFPPRTSPNMRFIPTFSSWDQAKPAADPKKELCLKSPLGSTAKNASDWPDSVAPLSPDPDELHIPPSALLLISKDYLYSTLKPREAAKSSLSALKPYEGKKGPYFTQTSQSGGGKQAEPWLCFMAYISLQVGAHKNIFSILITP